VVNLGITLPLGEFAQKGKGLALASGCLGAGLLHDLGGGVVLCRNFGYRHLGADLFSDSLGGSWQVLDLTGDLRQSRRKVGPYIPYLELERRFLVGSGNVSADARFEFAPPDQSWAVRQPAVKERRSRWSGV
jgi:hypothetical protein